MSFDWTEYLTLAEGLSRSPHALSSEESSLRSAISRAYYAAFCKASEFAVREGVSLSNSGQDHGAVKRHFKRSSDPNRKQIGIKLDRLRDDRNKVDYRSTIYGNLRVKTNSALRAAREILESLATI